MNRANEILNLFSTQDLITKREFNLQRNKGILLYNPDLSDSDKIEKTLKNLESINEKVTTLSFIIDSYIPIGQTEEVHEKDKIINALLCGDCVLIIDKVENYAIINTRLYDKRAVTEPPTSSVMQGPREGFVEDIKTNLCLVQKRLKSTSLSVEKFSVGKESKTTVAILYLSSIAKQEVVDKIRKKIQDIYIDGIADSNYLRAFIEERPMSIFPQSAVTEKPDVVCAKMLEGRIAVIVDGSPMVLTFPFLLIEDFQSGEDYYQRSSFATFLRVVRFLGVIAAVFLPGLFVALQVFHYNIIPMRFVLTLMSAVQGIPFKPLSETIFVIMLFELIREAGVRTPRAVGMAMSIVGALVLGETAVKAGIISSPAVMIVALSSLSLYTVPNQVGTMSILRIIFTLLGGVGGLYFIICGAVFVTMYLTSLNAYGSPYLSPFAPLILDDMKDAVARVSIPRMKNRPSSLPNKNKRRQK